MNDNRQSLISFRNPWLYLIAGYLFLLAYFLLAYELNFFIDEELRYLRPEEGVVPWQELELSRMRYFAPTELSAMLWKLLLLLPGTILIGFFFAVKTRESGNKSQLGQRLLKLAPVICPVLALIALVSVVLFAFAARPISDDEPTYLLQARLLLAGKLYGPPPPVEDSFDNTFIITKGKYTGKYTLGHPAILALGYLAGSPYFSTILLALLLFPLMFFIARQLYDDRVGRLAMVLLLLSPFYLLTSATLLSHASSCFFLGTFVLLFLLLRKGGQLWIAILCGLCLGMAFNIRPLCAIGFSFPFILLAVEHLIKEKFKPMPHYIFLFIGFLVVLGFTLWYNKMISGSYLIFPFNYYNPTERIGFGKMLQGLIYSHNLVKAINNLTISLVRLNVWLLGLPISLMFIMVLFFVRLKWADKFLLAIIASFCFFHLFYYSPGISITGPVYYFELIIPLILLSARGILIAYEFLSEKELGLTAFVPWFLAISFFFSLLTFYPEKLIHINNLVNKNQEPYRLIENQAVSNAVVFVRSLPRAGWVFGYRPNSPDFHDDILFARHISVEKNLEVINRFPDRNYYMLYYDEEKQQAKLRKFTREELAELRAKEEE